MAQWSENAAGEKPDFSQFFKEDYGVFLLRGKNSFGDHIFSYVKITFANVEKLVHALKNSLPFNPSDFGEVVAAGKGEPTEEMKAEIAALYPIIDQKPASGGGSAPPPAQKKAWDEY